MTNYTIKDKYNAKKQKTDGPSNTHTYIKKTSEHRIEHFNT